MWVKMGSQGPEDIANQLEASGMYIPGFRRDKRIVVKILNKYIPPIAILGSIFVGLLAAFGNMALGTLGSGTGILLTVDILYRIYTELAQQQFMEAYPMLRRFLGR
jgi:preprotein translocase subunit SecY